MKKDALLWSEIDLVALKRNLAVIRAWLKKSRAHILAIVKADAYGHGMKEVAQALHGEGVRFFGVANMDEARALRKMIRSGSILVLGAFHPNQASLFLKHQIIPTLSSLEDARILQKNFQGKRIPVHVKIDTGMGRLGVWHEEAEDFFKRLRRFRELDVQGVYTHFSSADHKSLTQNKTQMDLFEVVVKKIKKLGFNPQYLHAANSMALARFERSHLNLVRPGIVLYGMNPLGRRKLPKGLTPIFALKTRIAFIKEVEKGRAVSYGGSYKTSRKTRIAAIPVGYSHGYRVAFSNATHVIVRGKLCPVVGRVTMDQTLIDIGQVPRAKRWDEVVLIGEMGKNKILAEKLAQIIGSIPYEITCSIHSRVPRVYKKT